RECKGRWAVLVEIRKPLLRLVNRWPVTGGEPPQREGRTLKLGEPLVSVPQDLDVRAAVHVFPQMLETLPHRQIEEEPIIVVRSQIRGVPFARLQAPHETRTLVGQRVDLVKTGYEARHDRAFKR